MTERLLGGFEQAILLALLHLRSQGTGEASEAYAVPVRVLLQERLEKRVSRGAVYTALDRLEVRGLVQSRMGAPLAQRGGRARRHYEVTAQGVTALQSARRVLIDLWSGLDSVLGDVR